MSKKKVSPLISVTERFLEVLLHFSRSSRFSLLKTVPAEQFVKGLDTVTDDLKKVFLGDLVTMDGQQIQMLFAHSDSDIKKFSKSLSQLLEKDRAANPDLILSNVDTIYTRSELHPFIAEEKLIEALQRLKQSPKLSSISNILLGSFWEPDWAKAPFEECLTFGQFSELQVDMLVKKRSFSPQKMISITKAIDKALSDDFVAGKETKVTKYASTPRPTSDYAAIPFPSAAVPPSLSPPALSRPPAQKVSGLSFSIDAPTWATSVVENLHVFAEDQTDDSLIGKLIRSLPESLTSDELIVAWIGGEYGEESAQKIARSISSDFLESTTTKMRELLRENAPALHAAFKVTLAHLLAPLDEFVTPYINSNRDRGFQTGIIQAFLFAFDGVPLVLDNQIFPMYRTKSPEKVSSMVKSILQSLPLENEVLEKSAGEMFPLLSSAQVLSLIDSEVKFDIRRKRWLRRTKEKK